MISRLLLYTAGVVVVGWLARQIRAQSAPAQAKPGRPLPE